LLDVSCRRASRRHCCSAGQGQLTSRSLCRSSLRPLRYPGTLVIARVSGKPRQGWCVCHR
jgi:hypothetical protein